MAANRFTVLEEDSSLDSIDSPQEAHPADKFDITTLSAALTGARQAACIHDCCTGGVRLVAPKDIAVVLLHKSVAVQYQTGG